jgi:hypothetical protein
MTADTAYILICHVQDTEIIAQVSDDDRTEGCVSVWEGHSDINDSNTFCLH